MVGRQVSARAAAWSGQSGSCASPVVRQAGGELWARGRARGESDAVSGVSYLVTQVQRARGFERADQVELDVLGRQVLEQPPALAEEDRTQLYLDHVEHTSLQALLCGVGAMQHHVAAAGCC